MPAVNPELLTWARTTAGLSPEDAARKVQIGPAYGKTPEERLRELESGRREPSRPLLVRMAKQYRRPLVAFYLPNRRRPATTARTSEVSAASTPLRRTRRFAHWFAKSSRGRAWCGHCLRKKKRRRFRSSAR